VPRNMRAFVAINLSAELRSRVAEVQERLRASCAGVKWVDPESAHFTLRFLGEIEPAEGETLAAALRPAAAATPPLDFCLGGVGVFPNARSPRIVWIGVTRGEAELTGLAERVRAVTTELGLGADDKPFRAHLTLGRVRPVAPASSRPEAAGTAALRAEAHTEIGAMRAAVVSLMESTLTPRGPIYRPVWELPLHGERSRTIGEDERERKDEG